MDHKDRPTFGNSSEMNVPSGNLNANQMFSRSGSREICFDDRSKQTIPEFTPPLHKSALYSCRPELIIAKPGPIESSSFVNNQAMDWDPRAMLGNLSFLEQKVHQIQDIVGSIMKNGGQFPLHQVDPAPGQQLMNSDLTSIVIQLISAAGALLPSMRSATANLPSNPSVAPLASIVGSGSNGSFQQNKLYPLVETMNSEYDELIKDVSDDGFEGANTIAAEDQDVKDNEDGGLDGENLPPGSYEVLQLEKEEILAPHTHFCSICGKGFKRDANLRMHMRGHGDKYKTPAALAKPTKEASLEPVLIKRYSCPFLGCKRNKEHKKFQPLKTILCVKNHYKRSHCAKSYTCRRCNTKKFSVLADLKTHEKHCGRDKWLCSCGTTFSRKDKLFGHVALFQGHSPALPSDEIKGSGASDQGRGSEAPTEVETGGNNFMANYIDNVDVLDFYKGFDNEPSNLSPLSFDPFNDGGLDEFPRASFDPLENGFSFLPSGS
ncbi:zinc finger protein STOP1 homolog [Typha angustifolia]|uniref:zinc finger protein STOP1 homolog n=1 Tax=Typha angustifolia TaxID=59011 RepID=UPI003C301C06